MKMKALKIDLSKLSRSGRNSSWQKAILGAIGISVVFYLLAAGYLFFKPLSTEIKDIIDQEVSSTNISFDQKTLEMLKSRQLPPANTQTTSGKNPFIPF